jgi:hypothetical protein
MIWYQAKGRALLPSPEGVQHGDVRHPHRDYANVRGEPDSSDHTNEAVANSYNNTPPRATYNSSGGMTMRPPG